jgi:hypothetical protein
MSTYEEDRPASINKLEQVELSDQAARDWLRENYWLVNKKWKSVRLEWYPRQQHGTSSRQGRKRVQGGFSPQLLAQLLS